MRVLSLAASVALGLGLVVGPASAAQDFAGGRRVVRRVLTHEHPERGVVHRHLVPVRVRRNGRLVALDHSHRWQRRTRWIRRNGRLLRFTVWVGL